MDSRGSNRAEGEAAGQQGVPADEDALRRWWVTQSAELSLPAKGVPLYLCFLLHCSQSPPSLPHLLFLRLSSPPPALSMICQQLYTGSGCESIGSTVPINNLNYLYVYSVRLVFSSLFVDVYYPQLSQSLTCMYLWSTYRQTYVEISH